MDGLERPMGWRRGGLLGGRGIPRCAPIDPGAQQLDLLGVEASAFRGHGVIRIGVGDALEEQGVRAVSRGQGGAGFAAFEHVAAVVQAQVGLLLAGSVAVEAVGFEDGPDIAGEIGRAGGLGREGGQGGGETGEGREERAQRTEDGTVGRGRIRGQPRRRGLQGRAPGDHG